eukprot:scaffold5686_cov73-Skeletonema_marinoi.AAC.1
MAAVACAALPQATSYLFSVIVALWWWKIPSPAKFGDLTRHRHLHKTVSSQKRLTELRSLLPPSQLALSQTTMM